MATSPHLRRSTSASAGHCTRDWEDPTLIDVAKRDASGERAAREGTAHATRLLSTRLSGFLEGRSIAGRSVTGRSIASPSPADRRLAAFEDWLLRGVLCAQCANARASPLAIARACSRCIGCTYILWRLAFPAFSGRRLAPMQPRYRPQRNPSQLAAHLVFRPLDNREEKRQVRRGSGSAALRGDDHATSPGSFSRLTPSRAAAWKFKG